MNTPSQPRQHFYPSRAQPPSSAATRVQSAAPARPGPAAHVYPAGSQVMMIPSQISYSASQGAYYIPGQGRSTYVVPTQQYPVQPGAPGFYPSASPTEFGTYAGAYYPAQGVQQFPTGVAPASVLMNQPPRLLPRGSGRPSEFEIQTKEGRISRRRSCLGPAPPPHPPLPRREVVWSLKLMGRHPRLLLLSGQMTGPREQSLGAGRGCLAQNTALQNPSLHHLVRPHHHPQSWNRGLSLISQSSPFLGTL